MKWFAILALFFCGAVYAQPPPLYPPPPNHAGDPRVEQPRYDRHQQRCRHLVREKRKYCTGDDWQRCERRYDRRIRECMTR